MECQEISAVVACDLSAAFDTVNISVLLSTFHNYYGITGDVLKWVEFLSDGSVMQCNDQWKKVTT